MDFLGVVIAYTLGILLWLGGIYILFTNPGLLLVIGGVLLGIGVMVWPLLKA